MTSRKFIINPYLVIRKFDFKVLNKNTGFLFELNKEGFIILEKFNTPHTLAELYNELYNEFKIEKSKKLIIQKNIEKFCHVAINEELLVKV